MPVLARPARPLAAGPFAFRETAGDDVRAGLLREQKEIAVKHSYDARGGELFELLSQEPEYYLSRLERSILAAGAGEIAASLPTGELVEFGCRPHAQIDPLLRALGRSGRLRGYVPIDFSACAVQARLAAPGLSGTDHGVVGDYERDLPLVPARGPRTVTLLGNVLGNHEPAPRRRLLERLGRAAGPAGRLLLGVDLVQLPGTMRAAYDDVAGVAATLNRHVLTVLNGRYTGDLDPEAFAHVVRYDEAGERIEVSLRARRSHSARLRLLDLDVGFAAGEEIRTRVSEKFTRGKLDSELATAGLRSLGWHTDAARRCALAVVALA
jgi:L-histidine N-alpha-methyltransferase